MSRVGRWLPWVALLLAALIAMVPGDLLLQWLPEFLFKPGRDQVLHAIGFFILTLCFRGWQGSQVRAGRWIPGAVVILIFFALIHEGVQKVIPGRTLSFSDFLADLVGIAVGVAFCALLQAPKKV